MDLDKFSAVLNMNDEDFGKKLKEAIGVKEGETITITTPVFEREDGKVLEVLNTVPKSLKEFSELNLMTEKVLKDIGCQIWEITNGTTHWLYPHEWYNLIPEGLEVFSITGESCVFKRGKTSEDKRYGALSYGFKQTPH